MSFRVKGLSPDPFHQFYGLPSDKLAALGVKRYVVDRKPGFPDRVEVRDLEPGETALLLNFTHQPAITPFRSSHAIFVREGAAKAYEAIGTLPNVLRMRLLSLRAFDDADMMIDADVVHGSEAVAAIDRFIGNPQVAYIHAHAAEWGCYLARVERA
jgi:hypothetical protein